MTRWLFILLLAALFALPLEAQQVDKIDSVARAGMWLAVGSDVGSTVYAIRVDHRSESILARNPAILAGTSIGLAAAADFVCFKLKRAGHPWISLVSHSLIASTHSIAFALNIRK